MIQVKTYCRRSLQHVCSGLLLLLWLATGGVAADSGLPSSQFVIVISVDGLGGTYLNKLFDGTATGGPYALPNFTRLKNEGAGTLAAHCDNNTWETLPNHTSIITARPRDGVGGHAWSSNSDPLAGQTIHTNKGSYVAGVFDVAHDNGLMTGMYVNKSKFMLFDTYGSYSNGGSYNAVNGAPDTTGPDNGRDKIDTTYINTTLGGIIVDTYIAQQKSANPNRYAFLHINEPDSYGHSKGWGSAIWNSQVVVVDTMLGKLFKLIEQDVPAMIGTTTIILTADHGNQDNPPSAADRYSVPFFVWGPGVAAGADLYSLNGTRRQAASSYPMTRYDGLQPIRNAEANNLALQLLGLGAIPGSSFNNLQDLQATPANHNPVITSNGGGDSANIAIPENTTAVTTVTVSDPDAGDTTTYSISGGADADRFRINGSSGELVFVSAPDFEKPGDSDGDNIYQLTVTATDNGVGLGTDEQSMAVTVTNVDQYQLSISISGNGTVLSRNNQGVHYSCDSAACESVHYLDDDIVTLTATGSYSTFNGWSGDVTGDQNPISFSMNAAKSVSASFIPEPARVMIDGSATPYYSIGEALAVSMEAATIRAQGGTDFLENIVMASSGNLTLRGGFSAPGFSDDNQDDYSIVSGNLKIVSGSLRVERFKIKP